MGGRLYGGVLLPLVSPFLISSQHSLFWGFSLPYTSL